MATRFDARAPDAPSVEVNPATPWTCWLAGTARSDIDKGLLVRIRLPGASGAIVVEDIRACSPEVLEIVDGAGGRYLVASPDGVVLIANAMPTGPEPGMGVD